MPQGDPAGYLPNVKKSRKGRNRRKTINEAFKPKGTPGSIPSEQLRRPQGVSGNRRNRKVIGLGDLRRAIGSRKEGTSRGEARSAFLSAATKALTSSPGTPGFQGRRKGSTPTTAAPAGPSKYRVGGRLLDRYQKRFGSFPGPPKNKKEEEEKKRKKKRGMSSTPTNTGGSASSTRPLPSPGFKR
jgi:hypothetical protein